MKTSLTLGQYFPLPQGDPTHSMGVKGSSGSSDSAQGLDDSQLPTPSLATAVPNQALLGVKSRMSAASSVKLLAFFSVGALG